MNGYIFSINDISPLKLCVKYSSILLSFLAYLYLSPIYLNFLPIIVLQIIINAHGNL